MDREPLHPRIVRDTIQHHASQAVGKFTFTANKGICGAMIGLLNEAADGDEGRYRVLEYLFGFKSTKDMNDAHWFALWRWIQPVKDDTMGKWQGEAAFYTEVAYILGKAIAPDEVAQKTDTEKRIFDQLGLL
jgi:hypothetical protein